MKSLFVLVTVAYCIAIATAESPLRLDRAFVTRLLDSVQSQIIERNKEFAPAVIGTVSLAVQLKSPRPTNLFKVNFLMETYVPGNPKIKMYRALICSAIIETLYPIPPSNRLREFSCVEEPNVNQGSF